MTKHIERTAQTKQKLIDAFWKLYCEKKIEKITVKAVTDEAGFYRSTFYEYFSDVYEILEELEQNILREHSATIDQIYKASDILSAQKLGMIFCTSNADYLAVLLGPNGDHKFYYELKALVIQKLQSLLNFDTQDIRTQVLFEAFSSTVISLLNYWYQNKDTVTLEEVLSNGSQLFLSGAASYLKDLDVQFLK